MSSRQRKHSPTEAASQDVSKSSSNASQSASGRKRSRRNQDTRQLRRRQLLEQLEQRQLLAGPQLTGIQPNEGELISPGTVRSTAPGVLTFRFDQDQEIDPATFEGIQVTRAGDDGQLGTADDVSIEPGLVTLGDPNENEVVVRFAETLPDDNYRLEVFGYDDPARGIMGLRNSLDELFIPSDPDQRSERVEFRLALGSLIEAVVPQPVVRNEADGTLSQNRNEIVVYFNEDPLFVEDDDLGNPTARSAENPRFYQLLLTQETVRTTDDILYHPEEVIYDAETHTARLFFDGDINALPGVPLEGGTWRLRVGTAVDERADLILPPMEMPVRPIAVTDFQHDGLRVEFISKVASGESNTERGILFEDSGAGGLSARLDGNNVVFDFGGVDVTVTDLRAVALNTTAINAVLEIRAERDGLPNAGNLLRLPRSVIGAPPLLMHAVGDTLVTSLDVGIFGQGSEINSVIVKDAIEPQAYDIELIGGNSDPGHRDLSGDVAQLSRHINPEFGPDDQYGVTEIAYNFNGIYDSVGNTDFLNQITEVQKERIREALELWASQIGVQFHETEDEGITFAVGNMANLQDVLGSNLIEGDSTVGSTLNASLRIDSTFTNSAMVFSNQIQFDTLYGEEFTRKSVAGIGFLLGLEQTPDLPDQSIMALVQPFLDADRNAVNGIETLPKDQDLEPVFPSGVDVIHGQYLHRADSVDIDMYRFEVNLGDEDKVGTLTAESFAERLTDSSDLDTRLALYQEISASATADMGVGSSLELTIESLLPGRAGNDTEIRFIQSDRGVGDTEIRVNRQYDQSGRLLSNVILLDLPRRGNFVPNLPAQALVDAINNDPFAASIMRASITTGDPLTDISGTTVNNPLPIRLDGGGLLELAQNDDYFSEDSRIVASLGEGVYYVGVSASGNDSYDPTIANSGIGGRTQGEYELHFKFEPQVDEVDLIRDLDSDRVGVPGTPIDGDGDGVPGGAKNFWFQTRPLHRMVKFTDTGAAIVPGQTVTLESANGVIRTYEFVPLGGSAQLGNIEVGYSDGSIGGASQATSLATALAQQILIREAETGISVQVDGDRLILTGDRSITLSDDFRGGETIGRNIFVDKNAGPNADGSLDRPFNNIANPAVANAFSSASEGDIVRIIGNGGIDGDIATESDNFSYQVGVSDVGGASLEDGRALNIPKGVTTMVDAGALIKFRSSYINAGSSNLQVDRSNSVLQVLGAPRLVQLSRQGEPVETTTLDSEDGSVILTSIRDRSADAGAASNSPLPNAGDWGGLIFRRDMDQVEGRRDLEDNGIFLHQVNNADIRYGGGSNILIDSIQSLVNPILVINTRPTITFNKITQSSDSAVSASPDSFEETSFQAPEFQQGGTFTADYDRVGPDINNNSLVDNSVNGLFIRVPTTASQTPKLLTTSGRFDDIDIVHVLPENLVIEGKPGGSVTSSFAPSMSLVSGRSLNGGRLAAGDYVYKMTFVDRDGFETLASADEFAINVPNDDSSVEVTNLQTIIFGSEFVSRRLYRAEAGVNPQYRLVADLDAVSLSHIDSLDLGPIDDSTVILDLNRTGTRGRLDASLVMDPGLVMKLSGTRIELQTGTQLVAEGTASHPVVMTSLLDDRFGGGGTFDTNNDADAPIQQLASKGDWAGIYASPLSQVFIDHGVVSYAGGISLLQGGQTRGFVPLELQQAEGRITNTRFEFNNDGQDGAGPIGRFGRMAVAPSTIFIRGSQPILVGNTFVDNDTFETFSGGPNGNDGAIIHIDVDSFNGERRVDTGRATGSIDRYSELDDNFGPLVRYNRYEDNDLPGLNQITGMKIRGGNLVTESVWDDTDMVHLVFDSIVVDNFHSSGGLKLRSRPDESLVIKLGDQDSEFVNGKRDGQGTPNSPTIGTGLTATGTPNDAAGRIGGSVSVLGYPDAPVVLTSYKDDTVGAGLTPDGTQFTDNNGDKIGSRPEPNDWRSILLDQFSNDRNVDLVLEYELSTELAPGLNGTVDNAQVLGELAKDLLSSNETQRQGFEIEGFLSNDDDVDTYSFIGTPGTEVWIDVDKTSFTLDTVVELLDANGNVLARSNDSGTEIANGSTVDILDPSYEGTTTSLQARDPLYSEFGVFGVYRDHDTTNPRDAGIHFSLTGNSSDPNARSTYFLRVRSASVNPDDALGGQTKGGYRMQLRLTEDQEFPGSVVRYTDIRFANHGVHVRGLMTSSPLVAEARENESFGDGVRGQNNDIWSSNDEINTYIPPIFPAVYPSLFNEAPLNRAQYLGNILSNQSGVIGVAGELGDEADVDFYQIDVSNDQVVNDLRSFIFDVDYAAGFNRPDTNISIFYDPDGEFDQTEQPRLILFGTDSNIFDDLTSPNGENDPSEKLTRGSIETGDPLIGPVTLREGSYYVAITSAGVEPNAFLLTDRIRREPINSVRRIADARFDLNPPPTTADGPVVPDFFTESDINDNNFSVVADTLPGHGVQTHYDGSTINTNVFGQVFSESTVALGDAPEDVGGAARAASLDALPWTVNENDEIGGGFISSPRDTSELIPHISVDGRLQSDAADLYEFTVNNDDDRVIIDIDFGLRSIVQDPSGVDTTLHLFREVGNGSYELVDQNFISGTVDGADGSFTLSDPFMDSNEPGGPTIVAGTYVIAVAPDDVTVAVAPTGAIRSSGGTPIIDTSATYRLHVSVENHEFGTNSDSDNVLRYNRRLNAESTTLTSQAFDLTGYSAADLPRLYLNYRLDSSAGDSVTITMTSDQNPGGTDLFGALNDSSRYQQLITELDEFVGHTGIQLQIDYATDEVTVGDNDGLFIDDIIIGFAERGESIFNAPQGVDSFNTFAGSGGSGEYQLEARIATSYANETSDGYAFIQSFDTNDRHIQGVTLAAPAGSQLSDGDTFVLGDGASNQVFEFTTTAGTIEFGNTPVLFSTTDTPAEVAQAIRTAINLQRNIDIEAAAVSGDATGDMTDGRLALSGEARGSLAPVFSANDALSTTLQTNAEGHLLMPAILHDGQGDSNYVRTQSQVIVDSNQISDVRSIGIWSQPGTRDLDPEDIRDGGPFGPLPLGMNAKPDGSHPILQMPPLGNAYPGYAINLPTLNESVIGGMAPGIVVSNNTIDQAGYSGVKVDGQTAPWVLDMADAFFQGVGDGSTITIDAAGTRVTFEFEDISEADLVSGIVPSGAGDGVRNGNVPVYFRDNGPPSTYNSRSLDPQGYSSLEMAASLVQSIQGSILVTNGLAELVHATVGPSPHFRDRSLEFDTPTYLIPDPQPMEWFNAAVYLEGVTGVYVNTSAVVKSDFAPIAESVQQFPRIINNTIYGSDGQESLFPEDNTEANDLLSEAINTKLGESHRNVYTSTTSIGNNLAPVPATGDVDMYRVNLDVGDRLIVDIDSPDIGGADTAVQIFNARGEVQTFTNANSAPSTVSTSDAVPSHLNPGGGGAEADNDRDPFVNFFAPEKGTYFVAVSANSNVSYDPFTLSDRDLNFPASETGVYTVNLETYAPRSFVIGPAPTTPNPRDGQRMRGRELLTSGASIVVTQIPDLPGLNSNTNKVEFVFSGGVDNDPEAPNVVVPVGQADYLSDIMRAISAAMEPYNSGGSPLPNNQGNAAPGPIARVRATALGGFEGENEGINNPIREGLEFTPILHRDGSPANPGTGTSDFDTFKGNRGGFGINDGFGHDRRYSPGDGTTERYVFLENAAQVELHNQAGFFTLDPDPGRDTDQLINETGIMVTPGSSPALLNNVLINLHESVVISESTASGARVGTGSPADQNLKPVEVVAVGTLFQYDETQTTIHSRSMSFAAGLTTNGGIGPSNINGGTDDFNITATTSDLVLVNAGGDNFLPAPFSPAIDRNVDSLRERSAMEIVKSSVGIAISNVLAPSRDGSGILRADNALYPNTGQGSAVFGDRGANELADVIGPVAIAEVPRDNDAEGLDTDPNIGFINLDSGVYTELRIQLRDSGDASDPFFGSGIDNNSVVVSEIEGLRPQGANITVFENDVLLTEGLDYTFNYDATKKIITLTALAGIWRPDRAYRVELNNKDRSVLKAPAGNKVVDGDRITMTDSNNGRVVFEFESGYVLRLPDPLALTVPIEGTNTGGLIDGGVFIINDGLRPPVIFEFDSDNSTLPTSIPVTLPSEATPNEPSELVQYRNDIANNIAAAITTAINDANIELNVDVLVDGPTVIIGSEANTRLDIATSRLELSAKALGLQMPTSGSDVGGVAVGDQFQIFDGLTTQTFEFVDINSPNPGPNVLPIDITNQPDPLGNLTVPLTGGEVIALVETAIISSGLSITPSVVDQVIYLGLPEDGTVDVLGGVIRTVGVSRTPGDGDLLTLEPSDGSDPVVLEMNRTDERVLGSAPFNDGVTDDNLAVDFTRLSGSQELAETIAGILRPRTIPGLLASEINTDAAGLLQLGGQSGLGLTITGSSIDVVGTPDVTGSSTLEIFGPLELVVPSLPPDDGETFTIFSPFGTPIRYEFDSDGVLDDVTAIRIPFTQFTDQDTLADIVSFVVNLSGAGVFASNQGNGVISLGLIETDRVDTMDSSLASRRGIVADGELFSITQNGFTVTYEFDSVGDGGGVAPGNIPVSFLAGSSVEAVSETLKNAINNNRGLLDVDALIDADGRIALNDLPGTNIDVSLAPSLRLSGVPGGAVAISVSPSDSAEEVMRSIVSAINSVNVETPGVTTLSATIRGGDTLFVENGVLIDGPVQEYYLPAIRDLQGNPLEANRDDNTTQFTILMPVVARDFGDAADPVNNVPGRYPTSVENDGARHVIDDGLYLGTKIDAEIDGRSSSDALADDLPVLVTTEGVLFDVNTEELTTISINDSVSPLISEGNLIVIDNGLEVVTLEFDLDGRFDEDHFAIQPVVPNSNESIYEAIVAAIEESGIQLAAVEMSADGVTIDGDDEDGISFISYRNPTGAFNRELVTPISVLVTGSGILQGWVDYDGDGDWDPSEAIRFYEEGADPETALPQTSLAVSGDGTQWLTFDTYLPDTTPNPLFPTPSTARFRISRTGGLLPTGLSLSGEVEDHAVMILNGTPPQVNESSLDYSVDEETVLQVRDADGSSSPLFAGDDGLLSNVFDNEGDTLRIFAEDIVTDEPLYDADGNLGGILTLEADGTFVFVPESDFNGDVSFTARVTDVQSNPAHNLVSNQDITVNITVLPVNDQPVADAPVELGTDLVDEDTPFSFLAEYLIDPFYVPGPANELDQTMVFDTVGDGVTSFRTEKGGFLEIVNGGREVIYTPPLDFFSTSATDTDQFVYVVADEPGVGQTVETADRVGTMTILVQPINDAPVAGDDFVTTNQGVPKLIDIFGPTGLIANDTAGPTNETVDQQQTRTIDTAQFDQPEPLRTERGGFLFFREGTSQLEYFPPAFFSGDDKFTYELTDNLGATSTGTVTITVFGSNDAPVFQGVNGQKDGGNNPITTLNFIESKPNATIDTYDLSTWFTDPENDALTFTASVPGNQTAVEAEVSGSILELTRNAFGSGTIILTVTASEVPLPDPDPNNPNDDPPPPLETVRDITINIANINDAPIVIGSLDPVETVEDQPAIEELNRVFFDPDNDQLSFRVLRLDSLIAPSTTEIAGHPLIRSITRNTSNQLVITPQPNQSGTATIEIEVSDGEFRASHLFTVDVESKPDAPVARADEYIVPIGSSLQVQDPANGLLGNDSDVDVDDVLTIVSNTEPEFGVLELNSDGTFIYTNTTTVDGSNQPVTEDSFTYVISDGNAQTGNRTGTVTLTFGPSLFQNSTNRYDVSGDGFVSPIDALLVINTLVRASSQGNLTVPVSELGTAPPPYVDVDGDGFVKLNDALDVIGALQSQAAPEEIVTSSSSVLVNPSSQGLPSRVVLPVESAASGEEITDSLLTNLQIESPANARAASNDDLLWIDSTDVSEQDVDDALGSWDLDDSDLDHNGFDPTL